MSTATPVLTRPLFVRRDDDDGDARGRRLVAAADVPRGRLLFCERPLVSLQSVGNAHEGALACRRCRCFVGGPGTCLRVASGAADRRDVVGTSADDDDDRCAIVPCRRGCGEMFCSRECEEEATREDGHDVACTGVVESEDHPLFRFKTHAVRNNEIFLLVADWIAAIVARRRARLLDDDDDDAHESITTSLLPHTDFTMVPWWEIGIDEEDDEEHDDEEDDEEHDDKEETPFSARRRLCRESAELLWETLESYAKSLEDDKESSSSIDSGVGSSVWNRATARAVRECLAHRLSIDKGAAPSTCSMVSELFFGKIIGSFEQNAIGVRARHPLCEDVYSRRLREERASDLARLLDERWGVDDGDEEEETAASSDVVDVDSVTRRLLDLHEDPNVDDPRGDDVDALFAPLDGMAMFATACKMNHSCRPNVVVRYRAGWGRRRPLFLQCVASTDVKKGDELCISYVTTDASRTDRRAELREGYGFECACERCEEEAEEDDEEDSAEEDDDDDDEEWSADDRIDDPETALRHRLAALTAARASDDALGRVPERVAAPARAYVAEGRAEGRSSVAAALDRAARGFFAEARLALDERLSDDDDDRVRPLREYVDHHARGV